MKYLLIAAFGYLIGSFSMSIIISKYIFHDDVRNHGSGNAGATNVARIFGWSPGIVTFLCDFAKCALSMYAGRHFGGEWGFALAGIACLAGHCFPLYFGLRGGKAVSTGACVAFLIDWRIFVIMIVIFSIVVFSTKIVSISSITAAAALIAAVFVFAVPAPSKVLGVFTGLLVIFMHRSNIKRLMNGTEGKFSPGHRDKNKEK